MPILLIHGNLFYYYYFQYKRIEPPILIKTTLKCISIYFRLAKSSKVHFEEHASNKFWTRNKYWKSLLGYNIIIVMERSAKITKLFLQGAQKTITLFWKLTRTLPKFMSKCNSRKKEYLEGVNRLLQTDYWTWILVVSDLNKIETVLFNLGGDTRSHGMQILENSD